MKHSFAILLLSSAAAFAGLAATTTPPLVDEGPDRVRTKLDPGLRRIGTLVPRSVAEIGESDFMVGCETVDREYTDFEAYKNYLPPLGIRKIRIMAGWARCEKAKGQFDFAWLDKIVDWAVQHDLAPMMSVVYSNPLYADPTGKGLRAIIPHEGEPFEAWKRWVDALARHYAGRVRDWEAWNEANNVPENTVEIIAENNILMAEIIKKYRPDARITGIALGHRERDRFFEEELRHFAAKGKTDLFTWVSCHLYDRNPEFGSTWIDWAQGVLAKYAPSVKLRNSEAGAPGQMIPKFGFRNAPFTEITQAKWDIRRMLTDHSKGVDSSVFAICDMHYGGVEETFNNAKGLLAANDRREVFHIRKAYYAVQNVASVFDRSLMHVAPEAMSFTNLDQMVWFNEYRTAKGSPLVAFWQWQVRQVNDAGNLKTIYPLPSDSCDTRSFTFDRCGPALEEPVWVDLLTGRVYELPAACQIVHSCGVTFVDIPVYDSPCILTERKALRIR